MPTRVNVWDRRGGVLIPMFSIAASEAVENDPDRFTLEIPATAQKPRPRDDAMAHLFKGKSNATGANQNERSR